jgi:hypothetical protein
MAVTTILLIGVNNVLTQNVVYALPTRRCLATTDATSPTIVVSDTQAFTASATITLSTNNQFETSGGFIKSTGGDINLFLAAE